MRAALSGDVPVGVRRRSVDASVLHRYHLDRAAWHHARLLGHRTTDNQALDLHANGSGVMRYLPSAISPNVTGGSPQNNIPAGVRGATIAGGGVFFSIQTPTSP